MNKKEMHEEFLTCNAERAKELICLGVDPHYRDRNGKNAFFFWEGDNGLVSLTKEKINILIENGVSPDSIKTSGSSAIQYLISNHNCPFSVVENLIDSKCYNKNDVDCFFDLLNRRHYDHDFKVEDYIDKIIDAGFCVDERILKHYYNTDDRIEFYDEFKFNADIIEHLKSRGLDVSKEYQRDGYNPYEDETYTISEKFYEKIKFENAGWEDIPEDFVYYAATGKLNSDVDITNMGKDWILSTTMFEKLISDNRYEDAGFIINSLITKKEHQMYTALDGYRNKYMENILPNLDIETKKELYKNVDFKLIKDSKDSENEKFLNFLQREFSNFESIEIIKNVSDFYRQEKPIQHKRRL